KFLVTFGTAERGLDLPFDFHLPRFGLGTRTRHNLGVEPWIAHYSPLAHPALPDFKLRLEQCDQPAVRSDQLQHLRDHDRERDERHINHRQGGRLRQFGRVERTDIAPLQVDHSRVLAQRPGKLAVTHIYGKDLSCAVLEQAIGESAGRSANIESDGTSNVEVEGAQRRLQLLSAAAYIWRTG